LDFPAPQGRGFCCAGWQLWWRQACLPSASNREEAAKAAVAFQREARVTLARQVFPLALDGLAKDVAAGTFKRGWDGQGRAASIRRFESILDDQEPMEQARGHLALAAAAAAIPEEHLIKDNWARAVARYATSESASAEVDLASAAVSWDFPSPLRGTVLRSRRRSIFVSCDIEPESGRDRLSKSPG
jgi:hypothetical protein